jgi:hypothetical protein
MMARLIYACSFEIECDEGLAPVLTAYSNWISAHYRERRGIQAFNLEELKGDVPIGSLPIAGHVISRDRFRDDGGEVVQLQWAYPSDKDEGLVWRNEVRIGVFDTRCAVEHLIWIDSVEFKIAPPGIQLGSPSIIRQLCSEYSAHIDEMRVQAAPHRLTAHGVDKFLELLQSSKRWLPIVFLAPYGNGDANLINEETLAQFLAAIGIVVHTANVDVTWKISDRIGRTLSCFDGGVRIYWPGFSQSDDPRRHPLYLGSRIENAGANIITRVIARLIFTIASFRYVPHPKMGALIRKIEQAQRVQRVEHQKASMGADWEPYALELDEKLSRANELITDLKAENENLKANQQVLFSSQMFEDTQDDLIPEQITVPSSVEAAVQYASSTSQNLIVLESALTSAQQSPFQRPAEILEALKDLDGVASAWQKRRDQHGKGGDIRQHLRDRGWGKRCSMHISDTTRNQYGSSYRFDYDGRREMFEPHITLGSGDANSCASIHFIFDQQKGKVVVAHVGRHLPNTKK